MASRKQRTIEVESSSDENDSLLGHDSPVFSGTANAVAMASAAHVDIDDDFQRALAASRATLAVEEERRRSLENNVSVGQQCREESSEDEDEDLEVLPPTDRKPAAIQKKQAPRLSISGGHVNDPVELDDNDYSVEIEMSLQERLAAKVKPETAPKLEVVNLADSSDDGPSCSSNEEFLDRKPPAKERKAPPVQIDTSHQAPLSQLDASDSDDSEDSLEKLRATLAASRRQPSATMEAESSSDEDALDARSNRKAKAQQRKAPPKPPPSAAAAGRKPPRAAARHPKKTQEERQQERLAKQAAKEREKEERARQRLRDRVSKQAAKQAETKQKKRNREQAQQASGKFAAQEIAVLMDSELFRHPDWTLVEDLKQEPYEYKVLEYPSALGCKAVQWIRKDQLEGGAEDAVVKLHAGNHAGYEHLDLLLICFDVAQDFLKLLERTEHDEEDDYPLLEDWLCGIEAGWKAAWSRGPHPRPRILLLLHKVTDALDRQWVRYRQRNDRAETPPPTAEELHDAIMWMLIQFQVECIRCGSGEDVSHELLKITRLLSEGPYQKQVTELECIKKIKSTVSDTADPYERAKDCWLRQLQQVPRISQQLAKNLVQHYPTAQSLWQMYQSDELTEEEKLLLVADLFHESRQEVKLSMWLYRIMTSQDPNELLR